MREMAKSGENSKKNSGKQPKTTKKKISITTSTQPRKQTRKSVYTKIGPGGVLEEKRFLEYDDNGHEIQRVVTYKNGKAVSERITRPKKFKNAVPIKNILWKDFRKIVGNKWEPRMNKPFDPIASREAEKLGLEVVILNGKKLKNFERYLNGEKFIGTVIR